ncbi:TPA: acyltransferase family protein [Streptococcus suis]
MVKWVNIAKGFAIFLVVYGHVIDGLAESGYMFPSYNMQHGVIYAFHMPLFFFLSGLFLNRLFVNCSG